MRHLFWIDACYACSDGAWSSYTRTALVDDPALPAVFSLLPRRAGGGLALVAPRPARRVVGPRPQGLARGPPAPKR